ncbi:hypothetical protein GCM10009710_06990 [Aeromicrobium alkaliterrae]|uniref:Carbamoyl phosphate synthase small chain n=1 Tax=Aeromicrobium alkaliterrae TaxID=302168 RepID=A0ABN2JIY4_9ACTN
MSTGSPTEAILVLEDGRTFRGESYGAVGETIGEIVFNTGMTGYQETLTDPSYQRQIVVQTAPHIGNTGVNATDNESSRVWVAGYVVRDPARVPSSWRSEATLDEFLEHQQVVGIQGIDTRALTRHLRERGAMRAGISSITTHPDLLLERVRKAPSMAGADLAGEVSTTETYVVPAVGEKRFTVAAIDLGIKGMTPKLLAERGIEVHVLPSSATFGDIMAVTSGGPDGVFFSNGPGDPAAADGPVEVLRSVLDAGVPYFGICFGNQLFGRALGLGTYKLKYGHRGINQPVKDLTTGKVEVTSHNHGFAVEAPLTGEFSTPYGPGHVTHVGLNDDVVEGIALLEAPAFSVQYHPEAAAGPHDASYLFDRFVDLMSRPRGGAAVVAAAPAEAPVAESEDELQDEVWDDESPVGHPEPAPTTADAEGEPQAEAAPELEVTEQPAEIDLAALLAGTGADPQQAAEPEDLGWTPAPEALGWEPPPAPAPDTDPAPEPADEVAPESLGWTPVAGDPSSDDLDLSTSPAPAPAAEPEQADETVIAWASEPPPFDVPAPDGQDRPPTPADRPTTPSSDTDEKEA